MLPANSAPAPLMRRTRQLGIYRIADDLIIGMPTIESKTLCSPTNWPRTNVFFASLSQIHGIIALNLVTI